MMIGRKSSVSGDACKFLKMLPDGSHALIGGDDGCIHYELEFVRDSLGKTTTRCKYSETLGERIVCIKES